MTTLAPASASAVAMPSPMPEVAPVTIAVLPEMSIWAEPFYFGGAICSISARPSIASP
jgi:hypothetical protein